MVLPPDFKATGELPPGYRDSLVTLMLALVDWMTANKIDNDVSVPLLALTCGTIIKQMASSAPADEHAAHLEEGIQIAIEMIRTAATMESPYEVS
jgi:hypothetical protein